VITLDNSRTDWTQTQRRLQSVLQRFTVITGGKKRSAAFRTLLFDYGMESVFNGLLTEESSMYAELAALASEETLPRFVPLADKDSTAVDGKALGPEHEVNMSFSLDNAKNYMRRVLVDHWQFYNFAAQNREQYPTQIVQRIDNIRGHLQDARWLTEIFVCYRSFDVDDVSEFVTTCEAYYEKQYQPYMSFWRDSEKLLPGVNTYEVISEVLSRRDFAVIFLSREFWTSDFIKKQELPRLLEGFQNHSKWIIPIFLEEMDETWSLEKATWLKPINYQPRNATVRGLKINSGQVAFYDWMAGKLHEIVMERSRYT